MPELIPFLIGSVLMLAIGYAGYRAGTEKAQREAFYTVSTLRQSLARTRLEAARLDEQLRRAQRGEKSQPVVEVPKWMQ